jgi:wobble nucleotide-excising tRNase
MTTSSNTEIQELKNFLSDRFNDLERKIDNKFNELKLELKEDIKQVEVKILSVKGDIKGLSEKVDGIDKRVSLLEIRVKDQDTRLWTFVVGIFLALFGLLAKMAFFPSSNP